MPFLNTPTTKARYGLICFDADGRERTDDPDGLMSAEVLREAKAATDIFIFCHGWLGDLDNAIDQYNRWIDAFDAQTANKERARRVFGEFRPAYIGLHWPSKPWGNERVESASIRSPSGSASFAVGDAEETPEAADFSEELCKEFGGTDEIRADLRELAANPVNSEAVLERLYQRLDLARGPDTDGRDWQPEPASFGAGDADETLPAMARDKVRDALRTFSYFTMKKRARVIGEGGMHECVRALQNGTARETRIHLMGHSFGCVVVSSILRGRDGSEPLSRPIDSVALVQGAMSLWSYAPSIPSGGSGYFQPVIARGTVRGPIVTTRSKFDRAVGWSYPVASVIGRQVSFTAGDADDDDSPVTPPPKYGAIGAFGISGLPEITDDLPMREEGAEYRFLPGRIYNLRGSQYIRKIQSLMSGAHSDIDGPQVAHAVWQAALAGSSPKEAAR